MQTIYLCIHKSTVTSCKVDAERMKEEKSKIKKKKLSVNSESPTPFSLPHARIDTNSPVIKRRADGAAKPIVSALYPSQFFDVIH